MSERKRPSFVHDQRGGVMILAALLLPVMIGVAALVVEFGGGLLTKARLQRVADLAAFSGATAYNRASSTTAMTAAAQMVGRLNNVANTALNAQLVNSPRGDGSQVVQVTVAVSNRLYLSKVLGFTSNLPVAATAYASLGSATPGCVIALSSSGTGVTLSGGTSISAPKCGVSSNVSIAVPCGTTITTKEATYVSAAPSAPCSGLKDANGATLSAKQKTVTDPLASEAGVAAATGRISTAQALSSPSAPSVSAGKDIDFAWNQSGTAGQATAIGCTATWVQPTWTMTCPAGGNYNFKKMTIGGGIAVKFAMTGSTAATRYTFSDVLPLSGSTVDFGTGTYSFAKGLSVGGGTTVTFAAGTFSFGASTTACSDGGYYSICNTGTSLAFDGPSTFSIGSGVYVGGGSVMNFGAGTSNVYDLGASSNGHALTMAGGAKTYFADSNSGSGKWQAAGNINVLGGGGSCLTLPAATQHDIKGYFAGAGGTILGAGVYTVTGYIAFGASGGGDVTCNGQTVGVKGVDVTLVTAGGSTYGSGTCQGKAFCMGAGYGTVSLTAPTSGTTAKLAVVGPTSGTTAGAAFAEGATTSFSGAFYFPKGPISLSGGASIGNGTGQCLQIIGSQIDISGGTTAASACLGASASGGTVALVQ